MYKGMDTNICVVIYIYNVACVQSCVIYVIHMLSNLVVDDAEGGPWRRRHQRSLPFPHYYPSGIRATTPPEARFQPYRSRFSHSLSHLSSFGLTFSSCRRRLQEGRDVNKVSNLVWEPPQPTFLHPTVPLPLPSSSLSFRA